MSHTSCIASGSLTQFHPVLSMISEADWIWVQDMPILSLQWGHTSCGQFNFSRWKGKWKIENLKKKKTAYHSHKLQIKIQTCEEWPICYVLHKTSLRCALSVLKLMKKSLIMAICDPKPSRGSYGKIQMERKEEGEGGGRKRVSACCHATSQYANEHQNQEVVRDKVPLRSSCQTKSNHHRRGTKGQEAYVCVSVRVCVCVSACTVKCKNKPKLTEYHQIIYPNQFP